MNAQKIFGCVLLFRTRYVSTAQEDTAVNAKQVSIRVPVDVLTLMNVLMAAAIVT